MFNRFIRDASALTRNKTSQSAAWVGVVRDTVSAFITTAHHALLVLGILAIAALGVMFVKPEVTDHIKAMSPFAQKEADTDKNEPQVAGLADVPSQSNIRQDVTDKSQAAMRTDDKSAGANARQQQWVTAWLSKRYRVATDATDMLVSAAYLTAKEIKLDPLLILSVMAIESRFNPFAESPVGAQGLMQVMSKVHSDKFEELGGVKAALNPIANIKVGSLILKDYVTRGGSVEAGLKLYVGAGAAESDAGYGAKVLAEYQRLKDVAMGKKVPVTTTAAAMTPKVRPQEQQKTESIEEKATQTSAQPLAQADLPSAL